MLEIMLWRRLKCLNDVNDGVEVLAEAEACDDAHSQATECEEQV
jgi:hypothetical protein